MYLRRCKILKLIKQQFVNSQGQSGVIGGGTGIERAEERRLQQVRTAKEKKAKQEKQVKERSKLAKFISKQAENTKQITDIGTQYGTSPTDPIGRVKEIEPGDYGEDARYHQVDTSSQWGTPDLHSYGYGHEKPDISGESVKPYCEQMNELPTIEEEQEAKQAESPTQRLMNQVLG